MVGLGAAGASTARGIAKRLRKRSHNTPRTVTMAIVTCERCGEQFAIARASA